jgi:hypothetical protein
MYGNKCLMNERQKWFLLLQDIGCIVCLNTFGVRSEPDIHHILKGKGRIDDFHTLPLCPSHHRLGENNQLLVSRHPWKKEFEKRYGTEWELLEQVQKLAQEMQDSKKIF